jgi:hypothetical protein
MDNIYRIQKVVSRYKMEIEYQDRVDAVILAGGSGTRLCSLSLIPLELIEVQVGEYLGGDDIERLQDSYNRELESS